MSVSIFSVVRAENPVVAAEGRSHRQTGWLILRWSVVILAAFSRLWWLGGRPPHFDEGVNGWFTDQMRHLGCYQYDPNNYHGPLHFYVLFLFKSLLGRSTWALRLPTAIIGVLTVEWCFRFERFLGRRTSAWAAVAMLVSPATLYFQRDAIHETWLVFFLVLGFWGVCGLIQEGERRHLWAVGMAFAGMVVTKETYIIHLGCMFIAGACVFVAEILQPSRMPLVRPEEEELPPPLPATADGNAADPARPRAWLSVPEPSLLPASIARAFAPQRWSQYDLCAVVGVTLALIIFFYSGNFIHWDGMKGLVTAYTPWGKKADEGEGHQKPFMYWLQLIVRNEPWTVFGLLAAVAFTVPALPRAWRSWRCGAIALATTCVAVLFATNAWGRALWTLAGQRVPMGESGALWWGLAGLMALAGVGCALLPPPDEWRLRLCGACAGAACVGALFLPWVYSRPGCFTVAFVGLAAASASLSLPAPGDWRVRWLAIYGIGALLAYSIIRYKTPWCIISLLWPFFFTGGATLAEMAAGGLAFGRETAMCLGTAAAVLTGDFALDLNFRRPTDDTEDYVYVQSYNDVWTVTNTLLDEARENPSFLQEEGVILCDSTYPLPWTLADFEHIGYYANDNRPKDPDGYRVDFLLVSDKRVDEVESKLDDTYYKQPIKLRPALEELQLYLRASRFAWMMPADREPEFHPVPMAPAVPATNPDIGETVPEKKEEGRR